VKQVVEQLQKLVKGAPRNIQDKMAAPFKGFYDFFGNKPGKFPLSAQSFLGILEDLEDTFPEPEPADDWDDNFEEPADPDEPTPAPKGGGKGSAAALVSSKGAAPASG
jgi:hypothetical protein